MRGILGILLIGVGLVGTYLVLSGKFPPPANATPAPSTPSGQAISGHAGLSNNTAEIPSQRGSGGESRQSSITQLGHVLAFQSNDRHASRGGF